MGLNKMDTDWRLGEMDICDWVVMIPRTKKKKKKKQFCYLQAYSGTF